MFRSCSKWTAIKPFNLETDCLKSLYLQELLVLFCICRKCIQTVTTQGKTVDLCHLQIKPSVLVNDQLDALFFNVFISTPLQVSSSKCSSSGGSTCIIKYLAFLVLVNDQLDALFLNVFISTPLHVSSSKCSSSGGPTCINTSSGITHSSLAG